MHGLNGGIGEKNISNIITPFHESTHLWSEWKEKKLSREFDQNWSTARDTRCINLNSI